VDNTHFVPNLIRKAAANLLIAPRAFGKTTLLSLVQCAHELDRDAALALFHEGLAFGRWLRSAAGRAREPRRTIALTLRLRAGAPETDPVRAAAVMVEDANDALLEEARRHGVAEQLSVHAADAAKTLKRLLALLDRPAVLIDEMDLIFTDSISKREAPAVREARADVLKGLYGALKDSMGSSVHSVYVTGITQVAMRSLSPETRFITTLSYLSESARPRLGFTRAQIEHHFRAHIGALLATSAAEFPTREALFARLEEMYNGYAFHPRDSQTLFNPWSILKFFATGRLVAHWPSATRHKWLIPSLDVRVLSAIAPLDSELEVPENQLEVAHLTNAIDFADPPRLSLKQQLALFVHTGDLTIARGAASPSGGATAPSDVLRVRVPSGEVRHMLLPAVLQEVYHLPDNVLSAENAARLVRGEVGAFVGALTCSWALQPARISARDGAQHAYEQTLSTLVANTVTALARAHPATVRLRDDVLNEASDIGGDGSGKRIDVAWTLRAASEPNATAKDTTFVLELKLVADSAPAGEVDAVVRATTPQVTAYADRLRSSQPGVQSVWVVVFTKSCAFKTAREVLRR